MKTISLILAALLLLATSTVAQMETLQIEGPHEVQPGKLVRLSANTVEEETPFWIVLEPINLDYESVDNGTRLLFSSGCQVGNSITVILLAQQVNGGRIVTRQIRRTIRVVRAETDPPDSSPTKPEQPELSPEPPLEQSPVHAAVLEAWPKLRTDAAKELSLSVASNLDSVADQCASNKLAAAEEIWTELSSRNREKLRIETTAWEPVALALQTSFRQLRPGSVPAHAFHLRAAAAAIREAFEKSKTRKREPNR